MKIRVQHRFESSLPTADEHPYRTGPWRPQRVEYDAWAPADPALPPLRR
jgi:carotenoid cleavage dioxygenase